MLNQDWIYRSIQFEFEEMLNYTHFMEEAIENEEISFRNWVDHQVSFLPEEEQESGYEQYYDREYIIGNLYPSFMRGAIFLSHYSLFEHSLIRLCRHTSQILLDKSFDQSELRRKPLVSSCKYMKKVGVKFPYQNQEWNTIKDYEKVRHLLVHNSGFVDETAERNIGNLLSKYKYIEIDQLTRDLKFWPEFCLEANTVMKTFMNDLMIEIQNTKPKTMKNLA